jgi:hypothetical protein
MINTSRLSGQDPSLYTSKTDAPQKPDELVEKPTVDVTSTPETDLKPLDSSKAKVTEKSSLSINVAGFQGLEVADQRDVVTFIKAKENEDFTSLNVVGDHVLVASGGDVIKMRLSDVEAAMETGTLDKNSKLGRALGVFQHASEAGLSSVSIRGILTLYKNEIAAGKTPQAAQLVALTNINAAISAEKYIGDKDGFASDLRRISEFTSDAFGDKNTKDISQIRNKTLKAEVIKQHQDFLDKHIHAVATAYATANETGNFSAVFDTMQELFKVTAKVTETPYWQSRPESLMKVLNKELPPRSGPKMQFVELLHMQASKPVAKSFKLDAKSSGKAEGGFFTDLKARWRNWRGQGAEATTAKLSPEAAHKLMTSLANANDVSATGKLWKAPPPPPPPELVEDAPVTPTVPSRSVKRPEVTHTEESLRVDVSQVAPVTTTKKSLVERTLLEALTSAGPDGQIDLSGEAGLSMGVEINAIDFIPVAGPILGDGLGIKASVRASLSADAAKQAVAKVNSDGSISLTITTEASGSASAGGEFSAKSLGFGESADLTGRVGIRTVLEMTFANKEDAVAWLTNKDKDRLTMGDKAGPNTFTSKGRTETFTEGKSLSESTEWVMPSEKSSGGKLPGMRTEKTVDISQSITDRSGGKSEDLEISVTTYAGKESGGLIASQTKLEATKVVGSDGKVTFKEPELKLSLSVKKMVAIFQAGSKGDAAREILVTKMTSRALKAIHAGNQGKFASSIDESQVRQRIDAALRMMQDAETLMLRKGVKEGQKLSALGVTFLSDTLGQLTFPLEKDSSGKLQLASPKMSLREEVSVSFEANLKFVKANLKGTAGRTRSVDTEGASTVVPKSAPTGKTVGDIHVKNTGYVYMFKQFVQYRVLGKDGQPTGPKLETTNFDPPQALALKLDYSDFAAICGPSATGSKTTAANAKVGKLLESLIKETNKQYKGRHEPPVEIDLVQSKAAVSAALALLKGDFAEIDTGKKNKKFAIGYEDLAVRVMGKDKPSLGKKVYLDLRLVKDEATGKFVLKNPVTTESTQRAVISREVAAVEANFERASSISADFNTSVPDKGFVQARQEQDGRLVPVIGVKADLATTLAQFETTPPNLASSSATITKPEEFGMRQWAKAMATNLNDDVLKKAVKDGFTGALDPAQIEETMMDVARILKDNQSQFANMTQGSVKALVGNGMRIEVAAVKGKPQITVQFQAVQERDDAMQWRLPKAELATPTVTPTVTSSASVTTPLTT